MFRITTLFHHLEVCTFCIAHDGQIQAIVTASKLGPFGGTDRSLVFKSCVCHHGIGVAIREILTNEPEYSRRILTT